MPHLWKLRSRTFDLDERPLVAGIVNVTPDSFSDGGLHLDPEAAIARGLEILAEGADLVDVGAESTRPGAAAVPARTQIARLKPVVEGLARSGATVSVDTASAEAAREAIAAGAEIVNDVSALRDPDMAPLVVRSGAGLVLMHMRGSPETMQRDPRYDDVTADIVSWFGVRLGAAKRAGIEMERIAIDPGLGFGKTVRHNFELLARLEEFGALGRPVMIGVSRKSFLGKTLELPVDQRLEGGLAATAAAVMKGARILRTHDVRATVRAVWIAEEIRRAAR